ncbi:MAG: hypothetical protein LBM60_09360 [Clostridium sp.]|jgi:ABC-type multidrug transport system permease subunit|nr:hypothetical protein [Clostridium sp.]
MDILFIEEKGIPLGNMGLWLSGIQFVLAFPLSRLGQMLSDSSANSLTLIWLCSLIFLFLWEICKKYATIKLFFTTGETYAIPCPSKTQLLFLFHYVNNNILNRSDDPSPMHNQVTTDRHETSVFTVK